MPQSSNTTTTAQTGIWPAVNDMNVTNSWDASAWSPMFGPKPTQFMPSESYTTPPSTISPNLTTCSTPLARVTDQDNSPPSGATPQYHSTTNTNSYLPRPSDEIGLSTQSTSSSSSPPRSSSSPNPTLSPNRNSPSSTTTSTPSSTNPLSKIQKRTMNTLAARRYRQKRVDQMSSLEMTLKETESERDALKLMVARLEAEVGVLRGLVKGA